MLCENQCFRVLRNATQLWYNYAMKFEDRSHEETERQQRCARSKAWNLAKQIYKFKEKTNLHFLAASTKEPEKRKFVVDSRASIHMVSKRVLASAELETMRTSTREEATVYVKQLDIFVKVMLPQETPQFFLSGSSARIMGTLTTGPAVKNPHLTKNGNRVDCNMSNYVSFVVPGLSTSPSATPTPTSSSSSSQDSVLDVSRYTENPVPERSGSMSEELQGNSLHEPTETENENKNEGREEVHAIYYMNCRIGCRSSGRIWSMKEVL